MNIFDAHCDVLMKLWFNKNLSFRDASELHVTHNDLVNTGAKVQLFAIYIPEIVAYEKKFDAALEMVQLFHTHVLSLPNIKFVKTKQDIEQLKKHEIGAMLTLEGCDAIGDSMIRLQTLLRLGVKSAGLTWNYSNFVADGILEERGAGLSSFGKEVVKELNNAKVWTDVSHLSVKGFWDVMELAHYPVATHSNAYELCQHPRNLMRDQIESLIQKNSVMGITFVPQFLVNDEQAAIDDVLKHLEYVCMLGGEKHVGFGSDFDGIDRTVKGLERYGHYERLVNELLKHYSARQAERFLYLNFNERVAEN